MWLIFEAFFGALAVITAVATILGYSVAHCILAHLLGHAIFAITQPDTYGHTLRSAVFSTLYGSLIVVGATIGLILFIAVCHWAISNGDDDEDESPLRTIMCMAIFWEILAIPLGVVINAVGVLLLNHHGYQGPLPTLKQATYVGAVGQALSGTTHIWRFGINHFSTGSRGLSLGASSPRP
ncbi:hypothetical protein DFH06DRAFT_1406999 [Mycena polygramma]|nr:hypothetical protein DFH06DRAFT_1406999 [Mycena polygramma]